MITPYNVAFKFGKFLLDSQSLKSKSGAKFANRWDYRSYLSSKHKGLLLDGQSLRLSERESFQNVCVIARVGAGKTSQYIIPNVLDKANHNCSMVINDPKGEVMSKHQNISKTRDIISWFSILKTYQALIVLIPYGS